MSDTSYFPPLRTVCKGEKLGNFKNWAKILFLYDVLKWGKLNFAKKERETAANFFFIVDVLCSLRD
jgi:hypothetical protein